MLKRVQINNYIVLEYSFERNGFTLSDIAACNNIFLSHDAMQKLMDEMSRWQETLRFLSET